MDGFSGELVTLLFKLLPGFVAAWVFYGLTAHAKTSPFERVVEAMIFTVVIQATIILLRETLLVIGRVASVGEWTTDGELVISVVMAILAGLVSARLANNNTLQEWLREWHWYDGLRSRKFMHWLPEWQWTCRTSFPSEWYSAFSREKRYIILHLRGNRRLYGWPKEWPDQCDRGQFVMYEPQWLLDDGKKAPLLQVEKMIIAATDVEMVEFIKDADEVKAQEQELTDVQTLLVNLYSNKKGESDGSQGTNATGGSV